MSDTMRLSMDTLTALVEEWAIDRGILSGATPKDQLLKLVEEVGELVNAVNKGKPKSEIESELGDCLVVLTLLANLEYTSIQACLTKAYEKISKRKGKMIDGVFVKESDVADG